MQWQDLSEKALIDLINSDSDFDGHITESELYDMFDDFIDESAEPVNIFGLTYSASSVLKEIDPTAYRCMFHDYVSSREDIVEMYNECYYVDALDELVNRNK